MICPSWFVQHDLSIMICPSWFVKHDLSIMICPSWFVHHDLSIMICPSWFHSYSLLHLSTRFIVCNRFFFVATYAKSAQTLPSLHEIARHGFCFMLAALAWLLHRYIMQSFDICIYMLECPNHRMQSFADIIRVSYFEWRESSCFKTHTYTGYT
jgi:hypothetical protein